jgi:hypothetical protein
MAVGFVLMLTKVNSSGSLGFAVLVVLVGLPFYLWGCCALARAKGYSTAIVLSALFGLLFPMVVLLVLPDKHKHYRGQR